MTPPPVPAETPGETPAALLRRAAAKVRAHANRSTPGPWQCEQAFDEAPGIGAYEWWAVVDTEDATVASVTIRGADQGNAEWIALLSPAVAEPLAAWLDHAAFLAEREEALLAGPFVDLRAARLDGRLREPDVDLPLALARALLGSPVPVPDGEGTT